MQLPWQPIGLSQVPVMLPYLPTDAAQAGHLSTDHALVQLSGAGNVTARISLCGAGRKQIRKMAGTITVPAIPHHI